MSLVVDEPGGCWWGCWIECPGHQPNIDITTCVTCFIRLQLQPALLTPIPRVIRRTSDFQQFLFALIWNVHWISWASNVFRVEPSAPDQRNSDKKRHLNLYRTSPLQPSNLQISIPAPASESTDLYSRELSTVCWQLGDLFLQCSLAKLNTRK